MRNGFQLRVISHRLWGQDRMSIGGSHRELPWGHLMNFLHMSECVTVLQDCVGS